jgi:hypothetical protein
MKLIYALGGKCNYCDEDDYLVLEFHHTKPRTWNAAHMHRRQRLAAYRREAELGHVVLACRSCNAKLGQPAAEDEDIPF